MALDVAVKDLPNSQKRLEIAVSADECSKAYEKVLSKLAKDVSIPGFRKGTAPAQMVLNHVGKKSVSAEVSCSSGGPFSCGEVWASLIDCRSQACEKIIGASIPLALQQKDIRAIGQAKMADENAIARMLEVFEPGQGIKFEVLVDVWPQPLLTGPYTGLVVDAEEEPFEEEGVTRVLLEMRKREAFSIMSGADAKATIYGNVTELGEFKAVGAVAIVDLEGYRRKPDGSKGEKLPDLAVGQNVEVVMESGKFFEGFVEKIQGLRAGDTASVPITFPANHKVPELRGVDALFDVTIKGLKDKVYPSMDDEFANKVSGGDSRTVAELKTKVSDNIHQDSLVSTAKNINKVGHPACARHGMLSRSTVWSFCCFPALLSHP